MTPISAGLPHKFLPNQDPHSEGGDWTPLNATAFDAPNRGGTRSTYRVAPDQGDFSFSDPRRQITCVDTNPAPQT